MRRADRLFQILLLLRHRRFMTAAHLAQELHVSTRTIYRDVRDLSRSGVPIMGEAGVGYMLDRQFDLPPIMFDRHEIEALALGARMVTAWGGATLSSAAKRVLAKVDAILPDSLKGEIEATTLFAPDFHISQAVKNRTEQLRVALQEHRKVAFAYVDRQGATSSREVLPLGMFFWGSTWSLAAWCELRRGFRNFRLDRMSEFRLTDQNFEADPAKSLDMFFEDIRVER